jgi:hypothetical protein
MPFRSNDGTTPRDIQGDASLSRPSSPSYHPEREMRGSPLIQPDTQHPAMQACMRAAESTLKSAFEPTGQTIHNYRDHSALSSHPPEEHHTETVTQNELNTYFYSNDTSPNTILDLGKKFIDCAYYITTTTVPEITHEQYVKVSTEIEKIIGILPNYKEAALKFAQEAYERGEQQKEKQYKAFKMLQNTTIKDTLSAIKLTSTQAKRDGVIDAERVQKIMHILNPGPGSSRIQDKHKDLSKPKSSNTNEIELLSELLKIREDNTTLLSVKTMHDAISRLRQTLRQTADESLT